MKYLLFFCLFQFVLILNVNSCIKNNVQEGPVCEIVDIVRLFDDDAPASFDCLKDYDNSIHLKHDGHIEIECSAPYPIDMEYHSVLPADHFEFSFFKKVNVGENEQGPYNLKTLDVTFHSTILLIGQHLPWAGNYIFYDVANPSKRIMISVFIDKNFPLFLNEKEKGEDKEDATIPIAHFDASKEHVILPCRVQNFNGTVQLFSPDFEELTDGSFGDDVKFDPRVGFTVKWNPDRVTTGQYRCMTDLGDQNDEMKVNVVAPEDYKEHEEIPETNIPGTITLTKLEKEGYYMAQCRGPRRPTPNLYGLVNIRSNNPTTTKYTYGCTNTETTCENRRTGSTTDSGFYELRLYPSGILKCADRETLVYFTGADKNIYFNVSEAKSKNGLVQAKPVKKKKHFLPTETVEIICEIAEYITVKPIWWSIHYANNTQIQRFEPVENTTNIFISNDVTGVSCGISLWNSTEWFTSFMPIQVAATKPPSIVSNNLNITFDLGSANHVIQCIVDGIPRPTVKWMRHGKEIASSRTIQSEGELDELVLLFPRITQADEGNYICKATNMLGEVQKDFTVNVVEFEPPPILPPTEVRVTTPGINTTKVISTTRIITFFQFRPGTSDGQIIIPSKDKVQPGDILYVSIPNINSNSLQLMSDELNLTVRVLQVQGNNNNNNLGDDNSFYFFPRGIFQDDAGNEDFSRTSLLEKLALLFSITVVSIALILIILCGCLFCYYSRH